MNAKHVSQAEAVEKIKKWIAQDKQYQADPNSQPTYQQQRRESKQ
jgi:hypothetical protein